MTKFYCTVDAHTRVITSKAEEVQIWVDCINANIPVVILYHRLGNCYYCGKLGKDVQPLCTVSEQLHVSRR